MNWGFDPFGAKKTMGWLMHQIPGASTVMKPISSFEDNTIGQVLPKAYRPDSPWTDMSLYDQDQQEKKADQMRKAYTDLANDNSDEMGA